MLVEVSKIVSASIVCTVLSAFVLVFVDMQRDAQDMSMIPALTALIHQPRAAHQNARGGTDAQD